ncbi:MAG: glycerol kinase GlpK [Coriobacteriia bacterium]|nr:glycerol kinase GlpK [Coriobacteriia bacterium]
MPYILALDQGTTSTRSIVFDGDGVRLAQSQIALEQIFPKPGWVEHDANLIWSNQLETAREAIEHAGIDPDELCAIGVTNQRETVVIWNRATGEPIHNAIVWQDRRTSAACDLLMAAGHDEFVRDRTGLGIDPYFSATKIAWMLDEVEGAREAAERGELACGTIDCWLVYNLTGGRVHVTDITNASRTLLMNIETGEWDEELCAVFRVVPGMLPRIVRSAEVVGESDEALLGAAVPIAGICGDQQAALVGNGCFEAGDAKATFGTGVFALMHTGSKRVRSKSLATTVPARTGDAIEYALEGSIFMGGAVVQWLVEGLELGATPAEVQALAESVPDSGGVVLVPALTGLGAPLWDPYARGAMFGLTRGATRAHIARAGMEAIPLQVMDLVDAMATDSGHAMPALRVDGGVTVNELVMQTLADLLGVPVNRALVAESTALGVAYLAGLAVGVWTQPTDLPALTGVSRTFEPAPEAAARFADLKIRWAEAVKRSMRWEHA